jgi:hypothetical protein
MPFTVGSMHIEQRIYTLIMEKVLGDAQSRKGTWFLFIKPKRLPQSPDFPGEWRSLSAI